MTNSLLCFLFFFSYFPDFFWKKNKEGKQLPKPLF